MNGKQMRRMALASASVMVCVLPATTWAGEVASNWDNVPNHSGLKSSGGVINQTGTVLHGSGFTVAHDGTGQYTITYPVGQFPMNAPAFSCTPLGSAGGQTLCRIENQNWSKSAATSVVVHLIDLTGALKDNGWEFVEVTTK